MIDWLRRVIPRPEYRTVWVATALLFLASLILAPRSVTSGAIVATMSFAAVLMVISAGQTLAIQQKGLDLSVPGIVTLSAMFLPTLIAKTGVSLGVAVMATLAVGAVVGFVNGLLVTRVGITPLIVTLAMNTILVGVLLTFTNRLPSANAPQELVAFMSARPLGVPIAFLLAVGYVLLIALVMSRTTVGRRFVASGSNQAVARAAGINVEANIVGSYVMSGLSASLGAILLIGYVQAATVTIGAEYMFTSIAAVVIGGTSFAGGRGSVVATAVGAVFLTQLSQLLLTAGAPTSVRLLAQALAIAVAVALRTLPQLIRGRDRRSPRRAVPTRA